MAMTTAHKRKIASILFIFISAIVVAQPPPYGDPEPLPIDGGLLLGAFVALCYGVKKLLKNN
jgi:hypothetical protein